MSVVLEPQSQLVFKRPLTQPIEEFLKVKNVGTEPIAFKVKTTAPKQYCVRPNSGIIQPSSFVEVQVIFQPFKEEPAPDFKCKDKFLVQTAVVKPDWLDWNMMELWSFIEKDHRESLSQRKVKCVFLPPELPEPATIDPNETFTASVATVNDPPTPISHHHQDRIDPLTTNGNGILEQEDEEKGNEDEDEDNNDQISPSPTLTSTLPAIIDAANKLYDPTSSSTSLLTAHTTTTTTTTTTTPLIKPSTSFQPLSQQQQQQQQRQVPVNPSIDAKLLEQLKDEKERLQQELIKARSNEKRLEEQLIKEQTDLKSARLFTDQLQQQIKTLEQKNQQSTIPSPPSSHTVAAANAAYAMQSSPPPVDGYPPQVLLSVSALIFIFTYLFF